MGLLIDTRSYRFHYIFIAQTCSDAVSPLAVSHSALSCDFPKNKIFIMRRDVVARREERSKQEPSGDEAKRKEGEQQDKTFSSEREKMFMFY